MGLTVRIDAHELIQRLDFASKQCHAAIQNGLMRGARTARKEALINAASDIGVTPARAKANQPTVRSGGDLVAVWTPSKKAANIGSTGATWSKASGVSASTYRLTGGTSASLSAPHAILMRGKYGKSFVLNRIAHGKGTGHSRAALAKIFAESVGTGMSQADGSPRRTWEKSAEQHAPNEIAKSLQQVLDGYVAGGDNGSD